MPDTYRPLRPDDPVGTEVYLKSFNDYAHIGHKIAAYAHIGHKIAAETAWAWVMSSDKRPVPWTYEKDRLWVRVPDPWGELLAAARIAYEVADFSNYPVTEQQLGDAIAAVEAQQQKGGE